MVETVEQSVDVWCAAFLFSVWTVGLTRAADVPVRGRVSLFKMFRLLGKAFFVVHRRQRRAGEKRWQLGSKKLRWKAGVTRTCVGEPVKPNRARGRVHPMKAVPQLTCGSACQTMRVS